MRPWKNGTFPQQACSHEIVLLKNQTVIGLIPPKGCYGRAPQNDSALILLVVFVVANLTLKMSSGRGGETENYRKVNFITFSAIVPKLVEAALYLGETYK